MVSSGRAKSSTAQYAQHAPADWKKKDEAAREELMRRLEETGEKERLKQALRAKLIECGWRDEMKDRAKESIRSRGGLTKVTIDELVADLLPRGRASVPDNVKGDLLNDVREFAQKDGIFPGYNESGV
uniref:Transcription and mRNA export factor ENY2 n=1 Tax=Helicotheca tamesis TaxID=374047 RepID=A0A7S2I6N7_9STRA|mmetsp:Transcript_5833/g.8001  ORF Transcript_5833/g.8001 Transcript_5833/m.8001 type:complete len:128 (+) Transcript_5833:135-518(+)|eukprot:CAMPEP_0185724696 /NCGR_PEP_ID=MMETSP1171-20130828/1102_1 /TAXON_ID=374046 /ORGANISM="Helicotheca tamensis, Strain CCMP826" /LENGTH=127 /DNA_ID=CAMNT_0028392609 /DNA_START=82 /DNA_END=465 /DNA_ORIENTATION=+